MAEKPTGTPIPRVSVVVCTYNGACFLRPQLDSLLAQRLPPYEIIVSDDDSTDDTAAIVREYAARDARVKLHINRPALGFNLNFSKAFQLAEGDYVASCDQDDIWHPDKLSHLVEALKHAPLAFHNSALFTENPAQPSGLKNPHNPVTNELFLLLKPYIPGHECVFRRELLRDYADIVAAEPHISYDTLLCLTGATHGGITYVDEALVSWRRHRTATSYGSGRAAGSAWQGLLSAFQALRSTQKINTTRRYFRAVASLPFRLTATRRVVRLMSKGGIYNIMCAGWICARHYRLLFPTGPAWRRRITAFFTPLGSSRRGSGVAASRPVRPVRPVRRVRPVCAGFAPDDSDSTRLRETRGCCGAAFLVASLASFGV